MLDSTLFVFLFSSFDNHRVIDIADFLWQK